MSVKTAQHSMIQIIDCRYSAGNFELYGRGDDGSSVCITIYDFMCFMYAAHANVHAAVSSNECHEMRDDINEFACDHTGKLKKKYRWITKQDGSHNASIDGIVATSVCCVNKIPLEKYISQPQSMYKISVAVHAHLNIVKDFLREKYGETMTMYEHNVHPVMRFQNTTGIKGACWVTVPESARVQHGHVSTCDAEFYCSYKQVAVQTDVVKHAPLHQLSVDLECICDTPGETFPNALNIHDKIIQIGCVYTEKLSSEITFAKTHDGMVPAQPDVYERILFTLHACDPIENVTVRCFATEAEMITAYVQFTHEKSVDFVIGHNLYNFDNYYIIKRIHVLGLTVNPCLQLYKFKDVRRLPFRNIPHKNGSVVPVTHARKIYCEVGKYYRKVTDVALDAKYTSDVEISELVEDVCQKNNLVSYAPKYVDRKAFMQHITRWICESVSQVSVNFTGRADLLIQGKRKATFVKTNIRSGGSQQSGGRRDYIHEKHGVCDFDTLKLFNADVSVKLRGYSLNNLATEFLHQKKADMPYEDIPIHFNAGPVGVAKVGSYCVRDALLAMYLFHVQMYDVKTLAMSQVTGVRVTDILIKMQEEKVVSQYISWMTDSHFNNFVLGDQKVSIGSEKYKGATVLKAKRAFYTTPVLVCDFNSLYPSIIIAHNLCSSTYVPADEIDALAQRNQWTCGVHFTKTPCGHYFVSAKVRQGITPFILQKLLQARKVAKKQMKNAPTKAEVNVFNGLQMAFKVSANSVYGVLGSSVSKIGCRPVSEATTSFGREMIEQSKAYTEETYHASLGADVVYGDTDSIMINMPTFTVRQAKDWAIDELLPVLNKMWKTPINLDFEKVYLPWYLCGKKNYSGLYWTGDPVKVKRASGGYTTLSTPTPVIWDHIDTKGMANVRRDSCRLVSQILKHCLYLTLEEPMLRIVKLIAVTNLQRAYRARKRRRKSFLYYQLTPLHWQLEIKSGMKKAWQYIHDQVNQLRNRNIELYKLIISKKLNQDVYSYTGSQAHTELIKKMKERDHTFECPIGTRVQFVIVESQNGESVTECAEDPSYVIKHNIPIDISYYIEKQLFNPIGKLFAPYCAQDVMKNAEIEFISKHNISGRDVGEEMESKKEEYMFAKGSEATIKTVFRSYLQSKTKRSRAEIQVENDKKRKKNEERRTQRRAVATVDPRQKTLAGFFHTQPSAPPSRKRPISTPQEPKPLKKYMDGRINNASLCACCDKVLTTNSFCKDCTSSVETHTSKYTEQTRHLHRLQNADRNILDICRACKHEPGVDYVKCATASCHLFFRRDEIKKRITDSEKIIGQFEKTFPTVSSRKPSFTVDKSVLDW